MAQSIPEIEKVMEAVYGDEWRVFLQTRYSRACYAEAQSLRQQLAASKVDYAEAMDDLKDCGDALTKLRVENVSLKRQVESLLTANDDLQDELAVKLVNEDARICPTPGGCGSCSDPVWCTLNRVTCGVTSIQDEINYRDKIHIQELCDEAR